MVINLKGSDRDVGNLGDSTTNNTWFGGGKIVQDRCNTLNCRRLNVKMKLNFFLVYSNPIPIPSYYSMLVDHCYETYLDRSSKFQPGLGQNRSGLIHY